MGSFANVLIWRLPRRELPWSPRHSYCPHCHAGVKARDNIPLLSFLLLKGRCRYCRGSISWRYPLVEATMAAAAYLTCRRLGLEQWSDWIAFGGFLIFLTALTAVAFIDFETYLIPDALSVGLAFFMIAFAPWNPLLGPSALGRLWASCLGALCGGGLYFIFAAVGKKLYKMEAMGGGDVKLAAAIGAALGIESIFSVVFLSSTFGVLYAAPMLAMRRLRRLDPVPYGPFLVLAAAVYFWFGMLFPAFLKFPFAP